MTASPLGKYGELAAALTAVLLVGAAVFVHVALALGAVHVSPGDASATTWIDAAAGTAVGIVLGQRATTNGAAKIAASAHERIDRLEISSGIDTHTDKPVA